MNPYLLLAFCGVVLVGSVPVAVLLARVARVWVTPHVTGLVRVQAQRHDQDQNRALYRDRDQIPAPPARHAVTPSGSGARC